MGATDSLWAGADVMAVGGLERALAEAAVYSPKASGMRSGAVHPFEAIL